MMLPGSKFTPGPRVAFGFASLPAILPSLNFNTISQGILSQSGNVSYATRGLVRMKEAPDDRVADYMFRDFYNPIQTFFFLPFSMRLAEAAYTRPLLHKLLELDKLQYAKFPKALTKHLLGDLVRAQSNHLLPELVGKEDPRLGEHLLKRIQFEKWLQQHAAINGQQLDASAVQQVMSAVKSHAPHVNEVIEAAAKSQKHRISALVDDVFTTDALEHAMAAAQEKMQKAMRVTPAEREAQGLILTTTEEALTKFASLLKEVPEHLVPFIQEGIKSQRVFGAMKGIQKSSSWAKLAFGMVITLLHFGLPGAWFDFKILQPWQEKAVKKQGDSKFVVAPSLIAFIPGLAAMGVAKLPGIKSLGYVNKFAVTGGIALSVYTAALVGLVLKRAAKPATQPKNRPSTSTRLPLKSPQPAALFNSKNSTTSFKTSGATSSPFYASPSQPTQPIIPMATSQPPGGWPGTHLAKYPAPDPYGSFQSAGSPAR